MYRVRTIHRYSCPYCGMTGGHLCFYLSSDVTMADIQKYREGQIELNQLVGIHAPCTTVDCPNDKHYGINIKEVEQNPEYFKEMLGGYVSDDIDTIKEAILIHSQEDLESMFHHSLAPRESSDVEETIMVSGPKDNVSNFINLIKTIEKLCRSGSSRSILLHVDGDGSTKLSFKTNTDLPGDVSYGYGSFSQVKTEEHGESVLSLLCPDGEKRLTDIEYIISV